MAVGGSFLFVIDSQNKAISVLTTDGELVDERALTWNTIFEISQVIFVPGSSQIVALHTTSSALLFFDVLPIDPELLKLAKALRLPVSQLEELSYDGLKRTLFDAICKSPNEKAAAQRAITHIDNAPETRQMGLRIQAELFELLIEHAAPQEKPSLLRALSSKREQLGEWEKAKQVCQEYLAIVRGYDPDIRDRYGRILEQEQRWDEIKEFEGTFLSVSYFTNPESRMSYSRSYNRLKRAYANLGIPLPKTFSVAPTAELVKANSFMAIGKYEMARVIFKEIIDNEDYTLMKRDEIVAVLTGYVASIKHAILTLSLEDWQEIYQCLSILVRDYSQAPGYNSEFERDMRAAARQIEKLKTAGA
jgi:hypothetical protein